MKNALKVTGLFTFLITAFLNVFIDLGHLIVMQETLFKSFEGESLLINSSIAIGLFLLPFILLFTPAGFFSDKYPKNQVMCYSAWVALGISVLITLSYYQGWFWVSMGMTFLLAAQSAFYSPAKYGYLKELVGDRRLTQANGLLQVATVLGILFGIALFSWSFEVLINDSSVVELDGAVTDSSSLLKTIAPVGWLLIALSIIELIAAYQLPQIKTTKEKMSFRRKEYLHGRTQARTLKIMTRHPYIWLSILGLAVFWSIIQVLILIYPSYAQTHLNLFNITALKSLLVFLGIGLVIGSATAGRISRNHIEIGLVPVGAVGITISLLLIRFFDSSFWQAANFLFLGIMGGFFIVPLNALIQYHIKDNQLGRILASKNLMQFSAMLLFLVITSALVYSKVDSTVILWGLFGVAAIGSLYTILKIP